MTAFMDKTFCASPNCQNQCGRKMTAQEEEALKKWGCDFVSWADFCNKEGNQNEISI